MQIKETRKGRRGENKYLVELIVSVASETHFIKEKKKVLVKLLQTWAIPSSEVVPLKHPIVTEDVS